MPSFGRVVVVEDEPRVGAMRQVLVELGYIVQVATGMNCSVSELLMVPPGSTGRSQALRTLRCAHSGQTTMPSPLPFCRAARRQTERRSPLRDGRERCFASAYRQRRRITRRLLWSQLGSGSGLRGAPLSLLGMRSNCDAGERAGGLGVIWEPPS